MDINKLVQNKDESIVDFLKRALNEIVSNKREYTLEFNDGLELETKNYENGDLNINTMMEDYNEMKNKINSQGSSSLVYKYIDFLETSLIIQREKEIIKIKEKTEELKTSRTFEIEKAIKLNDLLKKETEKQRNNINKFNKEKIDSINNNSLEIQNEIKRLEEQLEVNKNELSIEEDKLNKYNDELKIAKEENNKELVEELTTKTEMQTLVVTSYQNHVDYITENIDNLQYDLKENNIRKAETIKETIEKLSELEKDVESKIGPLDKNNSYSFNPENVPSVKAIKEQIEKNEKRIDELNQTINLENVKKLINNKVSTAELVGELNTVISGLHNEKIENTISMKISQETKDEKLKTKQDEINKLEEQLNNPKNYVDEEEYKKDLEKRELIIEKRKNVTEKINEIEERLSDYENLQEKKYSLKICKKKIKKLKELRVFEYDYEIHTSYNNRIKELEELEETLEEEINELNSKNTIKTSIGNVKLEKKLRKLKKRRIQHNIEIRHIDNKTEEDYFVEEKRIKDETELNVLKAELSDLNNENIESKTITFNDLITEISHEYQKTLNPEKEEIEEELEEPIESYEDAPKGLLQKIKSKEFLKKAKKAIAAIVAGAVIIGGTVGLVNHKKQSDDVVTKQTVEDNFDEVEEIENDLEEPVIEDAKDTKSTIEEAQIDAIDKIRNEGSDGTIYKDVYSASNGENPYRVGQNTASYENATPGSMYALKDGERVKITVQDAIDYMEAGYEIVIAVENENQVIGFTPVELSENIEQQNGMSK